MYTLIVPATLPCRLRADRDHYLGFGRDLVVQARRGQASCWWRSGTPVVRKRLALPDACPDVNARPAANVLEITRMLVTTNPAGTVNAPIVLVETSPSCSTADDAANGLHRTGKTLPASVRL